MRTQLGLKIAMLQLFTVLVAAVLHSAVGLLYPGAGWAQQVVFVVALLACAAAVTWWYVAGLSHNLQNLASTAAHITQGNLKKGSWVI